VVVRVVVNVVVDDDVSRPSMGAGLRAINAVYDAGTLSTIKDPFTKR
jgi:hypothetical protein